MLIAFGVAAMSLLVQGGTIGPLLHRIEPEVDEAAVKEQSDAERTRIFELLRSSAEAVEEPAAAPEKSPERLTQVRKHRLAVITAQREALLNARDNGTFDADVLAHVLATLDASQITLEMRGGPAG